MKILNNIERSALYIAPFPPDIKLSCREWVLLSKQLIQTTYGLVSIPELSLVEIFWLTLYLSVGRVY